jgi:hypothetical protein
VGEGEHRFTATQLTDTPCSWPSRPGERPLHPQAALILRASFLGHRLPISQQSVARVGQKEPGLRPVVHLFVFVHRRSGVLYAEYRPVTRSLSRTHNGKTRRCFGWPIGTRLTLRVALALAGAATRQEVARCYLLMIVRISDADWIESVERSIAEHPGTGNDTTRRVQAVFAPRRASGAQSVQGARLHRDSLSVPYVEHGGRYVNVNGRNVRLDKTSSVMPARDVFLSGYELLRRDRFPSAQTDARHPY